MCTLQDIYTAPIRRPKSTTSTNHSTPISLIASPCNPLTLLAAEAASPALHLFLSPPAFPLARYFWRAAEREQTNKADRQTHRNRAPALAAFMFGVFVCLFLPCLRWRCPPQGMARRARDTGRGGPAYRDAFLHRRPSLASQLRIYTMCMHSGTCVYIYVIHWER